MMALQPQVKTALPDETSARIGRLLENEGVLSVSELARRLALSPAAVREALETWVHSGRVEILRPYRQHPADNNDLDYYRWKQDSDDKYIWEQVFLDGCPYCGNAIKQNNSFMERKGFMKQFASRWAVGIAALLVSILPAMTEDVIRVDDGIAAYAKGESIAGNLSSVGSDTLNNMMTLWAEEFRKIYPDVNIQIEGKGSGTAPPALIQGAAQLGPMSRPMKNEEIAKFEKKYGFKPLAIAVALDSLAVFVNKDNPLKEISIHKLDAIFSRNRKGGWDDDISKWGELGLTGEWARMPIDLYGRNSASGTYGYFKEHVLFKGDYKDSVKEQPGSAAVVNAIAVDRSAIGYSGVGYRTSDVKMLAISAKEGDTAFDPNYANVLSGAYPISRKLYIYVSKAPGRSLSPLVREFLKFVLSAEGQTITVKDGFMPLPAKDVDEALKAIR